MLVGSSLCASAKIRGRCSETFECKFLGNEIDCASLEVHPLFIASGQSIRIPGTALNCCSPDSLLTYLQTLRGESNDPRFWNSRSPKVGARDCAKPTLSRLVGRLFVVFVLAGDASREIFSSAQR